MSLAKKESSEEHTQRDFMLSETRKDIITRKDTVAAATTALELMDSCLRHENVTADLNKVFHPLTEG